MINFQGYQLTPGMHEEFQTVEAELTWAPWMQHAYVGAVLDADTVDSGHSTTTQLRPGLLLGGALTANGQLTHWDPYAVDGSQYLQGVYVGQIDMGAFGGATKERFVGSILVGGSLRAESVVVPGVATPGLGGTDYEILVREALANRFILSDDISFGGWRLRDTLTTAEIAADEVDIASDDLVDTHMTWFGNIDADAATAYELPAPKPGLRYRFTQKDGQDIVLGAPSTGEFMFGTTTAGNNATLDALRFETFDVVGVRTSSGPNVYQYAVQGATVV